MELSIEDWAILAHVVIDPCDWVEHSLAVYPNGWAVMAKIKCWRPEYLAQMDDPDYKTRAERETKM